MKKQLMLSLTLACASLGLQAYAQSSSTPTNQLDPRRGGNQTVMVTGCVARDPKADMPGTSTPDTRASSSAPGYMLTNARMSNDSPTGTAQPSQEDTRNSPGAPQTAAAAAATGTSMQIQLNSTSPDLRSFLGQRVEISGRFETVPGVNASRSMKVETVRKVADKCQS